MSGMKPTKEQFIGYLEVQKSGVTNMLAIDLVCVLAAGSGLTRENCIYIYGHYGELCEEYGMTMEDV